jgi:hypothetical protein
MSASQNRLVGLTQEITLQWAETRNYWRDAKSEEFERLFMTELSANVNRTVMALSQMDEILKKVRSDCE